MAHHPHIRKDLNDLDALIRKLPFALDDGEEVGRLYARWLRRPDRRTSYLIDLWTYCYVRRYFLTRFVRWPYSLAGSDLELNVERAYRKIEASRSGLREPERYPHWVIVICRNTFLNFVSRRKDHVSVEKVAEPAGDDDEGLLALHDDAVRASALDAAISRLPRYLQQVAAMRLRDGLDYEVIRERTGAPIASVRAYLHKALVHLRQDPHFLRVLGYGSRRPGSSE